jgi:hypothetical protein
VINVVVEGESDREVAKAVVAHAGHGVHQVRVAGGKTRLDPLIPKYNIAAAQHPWVVFRDSDSQCPVTLLARLTAGISSQHPQFCLRIAHSMSEAWLLADRDGFAEYFKVSPDRIPRDPETLPNAKQIVLGLCARSRSGAIRKDVTASGTRTGPLYVTRINEFASAVWNVAEAESVSDSLRRAVVRIRQIPAASVGRD